MTIELAAAALFIETLIALCAAIWVVASIKGTTKALQASLDALTHSIDKLETTIDKIEEQQANHEVRLSLIEHKK